MTGRRRKGRPPTRHKSRRVAQKDDRSELQSSGPSHKFNQPNPGAKSKPQYTNQHVCSAEMVNYSAKLKLGINETVGFKSGSQNLVFVPVVLWYLQLE
ncbi:hypothetical protein ACFX2I_045968 [Malus domestica]